MNSLIHRGRRGWHRTRWRKLGRHGEARICMSCGACVMDPEEFQKSQLIALCGSAIGKPSPVFNDEEMAILRSFEGTP